MRSPNQRVVSAAEGRSGSMPSSPTSLLADPGRLAALQQTNLLDTAAEEAFDRLARLAARLLHAPIALVTLVAADRLFLKACLGLPEPWASARQLPLSHSLCHWQLATGQPLVIADVRADPLAQGSQAVSELGVAAYLGIPLRFAGQVVGSLCVTDRQPRDWTDDDVAVLADVAGLVMTEIELRADLDTRRRVAAPASHDQPMRDLAARPELERRLADLEASYQALLERLPGVVYILGAESPNPVLYISPQLEALLGERAADWIGDADIFTRLVHPEDAGWVAAECERTNQTGEPFVAEYRMYTRDGQVRWVRDEALLVRGGDGRPLFWQGILTDLTATKLAAARLAEALDREQDAAHQLAAALERERAASEHLRAVDEMKTTFLQAVSHDLRTPLTTVLGIALTLEQRARLPADEVADLLGRLSTSARKLDGLLADLLDLDRLARGTLSPRRQQVDIGALVRRVVDEVAVAAEHPLVVDTPSLQLAVDAPKVERIVENLVVNAARHTAAGATIWVSVQPHDGGVLLMVEDEGPGVPAELREQIFQPFHKGRNIADHAPGSGIGLALVAQFASLHGGRAWVQDRPGGGASFRVFLPAASAPTQPHLHQAPPVSDHEQG
jgi:PAS domain S-box-containing protein